MKAPPESVFCNRCGAELRPGSGDSFLIRVEALADPAPPIDADDDPTSIRQRIERLLAQLETVSGQEAMDQVYRRLVFYLCHSCYKAWIEDPTG